MLNLGGFGRATKELKNPDLYNQVPIDTNILLLWLKFHSF